MCGLRRTIVGLRIDRRSATTATRSWWWRLATYTSRTYWSPHKYFYIIKSELRKKYKWTSKKKKNNIFLMYNMYDQLPLYTLERATTPSWNPGDKIKPIKTRVMSIKHLGIIVPILILDEWTNTRSIFYSDKLVKGKLVKLWKNWNNVCSHSTNSRLTWLQVNLIRGGSVQLN